MAVFLPHLTENQAAIIIASLASTSQFIARAYKNELGAERSDEYKKFAENIINKTKNAQFEGVQPYDKATIIKAAEELISEALLLE